MSLYLVMGGVSWEVERRHEMAQLMTARNQRDRKLYLFFHAPDGELRRSEIAEDFPQTPTAGILVLAWRNAEVLRAGSAGEMQSRGEIIVPRIRDVARYFWRAVRLRCPNCGGSPVLRSWFKLRKRCPACAIHLERGESEDYYLGGIFFNIVLAEVLFASAFGIAVVVLWPNVPWDMIQDVLVVAMIAAPIILYPISRLLWLALDLLLRPPDDTEMAWHSAVAKKDEDA